MVRPNRLIRRIAAGSVRFDPNAIDGDSDGIVQELTPFERPAPPRKPRTLGGAMGSLGPNNKYINEIIDALIADPSLYDLAPKKIPSVIYDLAGGDPELFEKMRLRGLPTIGRRSEKQILELVSEITIEPSNDKIFTIIAPPVPEIRELIDFDGTYKHVRIPDSAGRIRMYKDILSNLTKSDNENISTETWAEEAYGEVEDAALTSRRSFVDAKNKLGSLYIPTSSASSFDEFYERFLRFPSDLFFIDEQNQMEYIQVLHDIIGHLGTGRGFDRHGEWANHLALIHFFDAQHRDNLEIQKTVPWSLFIRIMTNQLSRWEETDLARGVPTAREALSLLEEVIKIPDEIIVDGETMRQIVGAYEKSVFNPQQTKTAKNVSKGITKRATAYIHSLVDNNITETKTSHASFVSAAPPTQYKEKSLRRFERFDPNARDGDGDGLVQELTPFERPASPEQQRRLGGQMGGLSSTAKKLEESEISDIPEIRQRFKELDEMAKTIDEYRVRKQTAPQMPNNNIAFNWENDEHRQYFLDNLKNLPSPYQQHWKDKEYKVRKSGTVTAKFDKTVKKFVDALGFRLVFRGQHPSVVDSYGNGIGTFATTGSPSVDEWIIQMILTRLAEKTNPKFWELQYQQWIRNPFNVIKDGNKTVGLRKFYNNNDEEMRNAFRNLIADFYDAAMEAYGNDASTSPQGDYQRPSDYGDVQNIDDLLEKFNYIKSALDKAIKDLTTDGNLIRSADRAAYLVRLQLKNQGFETPDNVVISGENLVAYMKKNSPDTLAEIMGDRDNFEQLDPYPSFDEDDLEVYRAFINDIEPTESELRNFISQAVEQDYIEQIDIARLIAEVLEENNKPRPEIITRMLGGGMSISPPRELQSRAKKLGVDLDSTMSLEDADNDVRWSSNSWSYKKNKVQKAADAVIVRKNKNGEYEVLMIGRKTAPFTTGVALPGGLVDEGENFRQTADREMAEETGIEASQAINSRYLGEIEARDWDTRFVRGVYVGATRYDVPENTSATAMSDAKNVRWIPVQDLANGKHRIAFGHAAWLAEAFSDDKELNEKFKLLLHASRLRNQELIRRVNKKRQKDGKELFTQLGNPSENYEITIDGNIKKPSKQKIELAVEKDSDIAKDLATMVQRNRGVIPRLAENMLLFRSQNSLAETAQEYGLPEAETQRLIDMYAKRIDSVMKQRLAQRARNKRKAKKTKEPTLGGAMSLPELDPKNLDDDSLLDYMNSLRSLMGEDAWNNDQAGEDAKKIIQRLISSRGEMSQYQINRALTELDAIAEDYYDYFDDVDLSDDLIDSFDYGAEEYDRQQQEWQEYLEYLKTKDPEEYEYWNSRDISNSLLENPEQDSETNKEWNKRRVNPPQQPSLFDDIDVNKKVPAKKRKKKSLRKIFGRRAQGKNKKFFNTERYYGAEKVKQRAKEQLEQFREWKKAGAWNALHAAHYDWWMFPVDRGSMAYGDGYNVAGKNRKELMKDKEFMSNLREAIDIYAEAMGWDLEKSEWRDDLDWDGGQDPRAQAYGARLYKIARSAQVFGLDDEFESIYAMVQSLRSIPEIRKRIGKNDYWDNPDVPINEVTPGTNRINRRVGISSPVSKSKNKKKLGGGMAPPRSPSTSQNSNDNSRKLRSITGMSADDWFILFDELNQNLSDINSGEIKVPASVKIGIMRLISLLADLEPETKTYNNILVHMSDMDVIQIRKAIKQILDADFDIYGLLQFQKIIPNKQTPMLAE